MKKCKDKGDPIIIDPFIYRGRVVVGRYNLSLCQKIRVYGLSWLYLLALLYVIGREFACGCVYLTVETATPVIIVSIFMPLYTFFTAKQEYRKNHIYDGEIT